jgi:hypothetical protein
MKTKCVLSTSTSFNWGKKSDVVKLAGKHTKGWTQFNGRSDAIAAIIEAMTSEQIRAQFALFFNEGHGEPSATLKTMLLEVLRVGSYGSEATDKYTVWSRKFNVVSSLYGDVIETIGESFHKTGSNTFAKWVGVVIEAQKDERYLKKSKDIQKWVLNNHFQMLRKVDLDFLLCAGMALLGQTGMQCAQDTVRKVISIVQMIIAANATVAVYDDDRMLWVLKNDTYGSVIGDIEMTGTIEDRVEDVEMTGAIEDRVEDSRKRIVTPSKDEQPMKVMRVGDEPKLSRSLFSDSNIGDETGKLLDMFPVEDDTSVLDKSVKTLKDQNLGRVHSNDGLATMKGNGYREDDELVENFALERILNTSKATTGNKPRELVLTEEEKDRISKDAEYEQYLLLKKKFDHLIQKPEKVVIEHKANSMDPSGKFKNHIDQYEFEN